MHKIAVLPLDGIGKEMVPEGISVMEAVRKKFRIEFSWHEFARCFDYYQQHGRMMSEYGLE